jgi:hypothetical protein
MTSTTRKMVGSVFFYQSNYPVNKLSDGQVTLFPDASFIEETSHRARKKKTDHFVDYARC